MGFSSRNLFTLLSLRERQGILQALLPFTKEAAY
jgi:hypothetical protein